MTALTFNKDSWHWWVAVQWGNLHKDIDTTDLCYYMRRVFEGAVVLLFIAAMAGGVAGGVMYLTGSMLAWLVFILTNEMVQPSQPAAIGLLLTLFSTAVTLLNYVPSKISEYRRNKAWDKILNPQESKPDGFVSNAYRAWKDKMCMKVELVSNKDTSNETY